MQIILFMLYFALSLIHTPAFADTWPTFIYPDKQLITDLKFFDNRNCPTGEVLVKNNSVININQYTCKTYCPPEWQWIAKSDEKCHPLSDLEFKSYKVAHYPQDPENRFWDYSIVTASYGPKQSNEVFFEYEMKTPRNEYWYCTQRDKVNSISCANDF
jgi:hypothetical protein